MGITGAAGAAGTASAAAVTSTGLFSVAHCSQTQTVLPSLVVTA
ncbi:MAG: hypothetical protein UY06_C0008G0007 [Candidatus Amesbacteria bacterium GW2011_GWA2_47_70]|nr:MAG: hypothetical protein UX52_C0026G0004 [Candidatus Amesbacteria bacterium GW2011_GWA1_46_35]KKU79996.1 MAG: hypothetical protein UY06_C0008G0007 [Candidatus Amesbacteria bacterium GW2011_GWA2_47_70]